MPPVPTLTTRLWLAWVCFWRVLVDPTFARSALSLHAGETGAPAPPLPEAPPASSRPPDPALQLLGLLQREGRFVDFLEQDITSFADAEVGAAARVVHAGCRKTVRAHVKLGPVRSEEEGATITVPVGFSPDEIKLTGRVAGSAPFTGVLRHRGWRATDLTLPAAVRVYDASVLCPAEVEL